MSGETFQCIYEGEEGVEDLEQYCGGGFHPIDIGDEIHNGRYRVIHKLGYGSYSTVWLARDQQQNRFVSLKVLTASASQQGSEIRILKHLGLQHHGSWLSGSPFVLGLLDEFEILGPNGSHRCIVTEVLGPRISAMTLDSDQFRLPLEISRKVALQCAWGLAYIHSCGIVHGDLHNANILFRIPISDTWTTDQVCSCLGIPDKFPIIRADGQPPAPAAPRYAVLPPSPRKLRHVCLGNVCSIQIVDFGESFFSKGEVIPKALHTAIAIAAPEILLGDPVGPGVDIWALACILYQLLGGRPLFESFWACRDEVLIRMVRMLGKFPERWWGKWESRVLYFHEDGGFKPSQCPWAGQPVALGKLMEKKSNVPEQEEVEAFEKMLRMMLRYKPEERVGAREVLKLLPAVFKRSL